MNDLSPLSLVMLCEKQTNFSIGQIKKWFDFDPMFALAELSRIFKEPQQKLAKNCKYLSKNIQQTEKTKRAFHNTLIQFPLDMLFNPSHEMNISCFWKDQRHINLLSKHLFLVENKEALLPYLEKIKIWELFPVPLKPYLQKEIEGVLKKEEPLQSKKILTDCFEWKIYTSAFASLALKSPEVILKKYDKVITDQNKKDLCRHAEKFLGASLRMHLQSLQEQVDFEQSFESFVNLLTQSIKILTPILKANPTLEDKPAAKATLLNQFLKFLGFETQIYKRMDLEPTETCAFYHCFILVQDPFSHNTMLVDPSYSKYLPLSVLKGISLVEAPILISPKSEVKKQICEFLKRAGVTTFLNEEKLWNVEGYEEVFFNQSEEILFTVSIDIPRFTETHRDLDKMLEKVGLKKEILTQKTTSFIQELWKQYRAFKVPHKGLPENLKLELLNNLRKVSSEDREKFYDLLNLDKRPYNFLKLEMIGYYMATQAQINTNQISDQTIALYFASGTDITIPMLTLNASRLYLVDRTAIDVTKLVDLKKLETIDLITQFHHLNSLIIHKKKYGGAKTEMMSKHPELCILYELACLGIKPNQLQIQRNQDGTTSLHFSWAYHKQQSRPYQITFIQADITKPQKYPESLKHLLDDGIDYYYQKAAEDLPHHQGTFLPVVTSAIKSGGYSLMSEISREGVKIDSSEYFKNFNDITENALLKAYKKLLELPLFDQINDKPEKCKATALHHDYWWNVIIRQKF